MRVEDLLAVPLSYVLGIPPLFLLYPVASTNGWILIKPVPKEEVERRNGSSYLLDTIICLKETEAKFTSLSI